MTGGRCLPGHPRGPREPLAPSDDDRIARLEATVELNRREIVRLTTEVRFLVCEAVMPRIQSGGDRES